MFSIIGHVAVGFKRLFVLVKPTYEESASLSYVRPVATLACQFVCPDRMYFSVVLCFGISSFWMMFFVRSEILRSVILNMFVINVVSLPMYVKEAHFCVAVSVCPSGVTVG